MERQKQEVETPYSMYYEFQEEDVSQVELERPAVSVRQEDEKSFLRKTAKQHVAEAKKALADGYKPNKNPLKASWGRVSDAKRHLEAVKPKSKEYPEAKRLIKKVQARLAEMEKVSVTLVENLMMRQREMLVEELEFLCLTKGLEARIALSGPGKSRLVMECAPFCEAHVHKITRDSDFLAYLEKAGFTKATLGDGDGFAWQHSFEK